MKTPLKFSVYLEKKLKMKVLKKSKVCSASVAGG